MILRNQKNAASYYPKHAVTEQNRSIEGKVEQMKWPKNTVLNHLTELVEVLPKYAIYLYLTFNFITLQTFNCHAQFSFVHITDLHIADGLSAGSYDLNGEKFKQMLDAINSMNPKPAFVIATGDISHAGNYDPNGMFPALTQYLYPLSLINPGVGAYFIDSLQTIPIYFTPGNHDFRTGNLPPFSNPVLTYYKAFVAPDSDYAITFGNALILFLNSGYDDLRPLWEDSNYMTPEGSGLTANQCSWIRNILSANHEKKKIIAMHHPPVDVAGTFPDGSPWTGTILDPGDGSIKYNRTTLLDICDSNQVDIVLAGHQHMNVAADKNANVISENWSGGTRYIQTASCMDLAYRIITVDTSFVWVSTPQIAIIANDNNNIRISKKEQLFKISYNPLQTCLSVSYSNNGVYNPANIKINLINSMGLQTIKHDIAVYRGSEITIITGKLPKGLYIATLQSENEIMNNKFIVY